MKKNGFFMIFAFLFSFSFILHATHIELKEDKKTGTVFQVRKQTYRFSTLFEFHSQKEFLGTNRKSCFNVRTHYDLYDLKGQYEGVGICRIFTLGALYTWGKEIDVYDAEGNNVGLIDGQVVTGAGTKYSIYNAEGNRVGIAYLDSAKGIFTILDPDNEQHYLVSLQRNFILDTIDNWDVFVYEPEAIDMRIVKIFSAFVVDTQEDFKKYR